MGNSQSQGKGKRKTAEAETSEGASTSSSISSADAGVGSGQYDVFLSFSGSDTRKEFTDHLYQSLVRAGIVRIHIFKDDKSIPIGEEFSSQIFNAIARSKISIPIISENYASRKWCLLELIHIMDRKKSSSHIVLPIFYKVAPSDVRYLKGNFKKAFHKSEKHFNDEDIQKAKQALREVSYLHGWESSKVANGREGELIQLVVKTVSSELQKDFQLHIPGELVGLDGRLREIMNWIRSPSVNARMIGIYGMGGIGKTTLAKCIYNQLLVEFERASFLPNVREEATHHDGMKNLQSQLISDILGSDYKVSRIDDGINIIKSRFKGKKVLILLDDIDDRDQLDKLAGERDWFIAGSMIIVTTRNEAVLVQSKFKVDYKYEMEGLGQVESLLLFNRHAFRIDYSQRDFESISRDIVSLMGGLPLALEVVGSYLYERRNRKVWEEVREQLQSQPHRDVEKTLRISYDALEDGHKQIFVDIACFFIGKSFNIWGQYMMCMWEGCGLYPSQAIEELKLRCLIKIVDDDQLTLEMHDQLRDLGRSIFCQGQPPEKRSGPWDNDYEGVPRVLRENENRERFDRLMRAALRGDEDLSEVRWLQWWDLESQIASVWTANLRLPNLAVLDLEGSDRITEDWEGWRSLRASPRLRLLKLSHCYNLRSTPNLSAFTQLKILNLFYCNQLEHLHPSIGELKSLVSLDLSHCHYLKELPEEVGELKDLEELHASFCCSLRGIPSSIGRLKSLRTLQLCRTAISDLPESIQNLSSLQRLNLWGCNELRSVPELPSSLADLVVRYPSLRRPPLSSLIHLKGLRLTECHLLEDIREDWEGWSWLGRVCPRLRALDLTRCENLRSTPDLSAFTQLTFLNLSGCKQLEHLRPSIGKLKSLVSLDLSGCRNLKELPEEVGELKDLEELDLTWSGIRRIPSSIGRLKSLRTLNLKATLISDLPKSIQNLSSLERLNLRYCDKLRSVPELPPSLADLKVFSVRLRLPQLCSLIHLKRLCLEGCHLLEDITDLPSGLWKLDGFRYLELFRIFEYSFIEILDLSELVHLKRLEACDCNNLVEIRGLDNLKFLEDIRIDYCNSIKNLLYPKSECLKKIKVRCCDNLVEIQGPVHGAMFLEELSIWNCKSLETLPDLTGCEKLRHPIIEGCWNLTQIRGFRWDSINRYQKRPENNLENGFFSNNESYSDDGDES